MSGESKQDASQNKKHFRKNVQKRKESIIYNRLSCIVYELLCGLESYYSGRTKNILYYVYRYRMIFEVLSGKSV